MQPVLASFDQHMRRRRSDAIAANPPQEIVELSERVRKKDSGLFVERYHADEVAYRAMLLERVAQRKILPYLIVIPPPVAGTLQSSLIFEITNDPVRCPLSDAYLLGNLTQRGVWIGGKGKQYVSVVSKECPCGRHLPIVS